MHSLSLWYCFVSRTNTNQQKRETEINSAVIRFWIEDWLICSSSCSVMMANILKKIYSNWQPLLLQVLSRISQIACDIYLIYSIHDKAYSLCMLWSIPQFQLFPASRTKVVIMNILLFDCDIICVVYLFAWKT